MSTHRLAFSVLVWSLAGLAASAEAFEKSPGDSANKSGSTRAAAASGYPWKMNTEYRFLWLHKREKVGETRFRVETVPFPGRPRDRLYEVRSTRSYNRAGVIQQATATTHVSLKGIPERFEEDLTVLHPATAHPSRQHTKFERRGRTGRVTYRQNGLESKPVVREQVLPEGTFLCANQAVEHWVVFASTLPEEFESRKVKLFYPDHRQVFDVHLRKKADETIQVGKKTVPARRYAFRSTRNELRGNLWLGLDRRLLQIEFPFSQLKVVLAE